MAGLLKCCACVSILLCAVFGTCRMILQKKLWLTLTITFGTIAYHFFVRLFIGAVFNHCLKNHVDDSAR